MTLIVQRRRALRCKNSLSRGALRVRTDWTEAHFKNIKAESHDAHCLVIGPIGAVNSATRERSDRLMRTLICPTLAAHGYNARRPDHFMSNHGDMNDDILRRLIDEPLVIADLNEHNPNVYYELASAMWCANPSSTSFRWTTNCPSTYRACARSRST